VQPSAVRPAAARAEDAALPFLHAVLPRPPVRGLVVAAVRRVLLLVRRGRAFRVVVDAVVIRLPAVRGHETSRIEEKREPYQSSVHGCGGRIGLGSWVVGLGGM